MPDKNNYPKKNTKKNKKSTNTKNVKQGKLRCKVSHCVLGTSILIQNPSRTNQADHYI
jgi:hypothetical protein